MENGRKPKKSRLRDPINKLTRGYQAQVKEAHREIDKCAKTGRSGKIITPNYVNDVITPLAKELKERLPFRNLSVCDKVEIFGTNRGYFLLSVGEQVLGGFSYPGPGRSHINFTVFAHGKPWGSAIVIKKLSQLSKVISDLLTFLGPCNLECDEN